MKKPTLKVKQTTKSSTNKNTSKLETINEKRVEGLTGSMENVAKYIDDVAKFLSDNMNKAIDGNSWKDYMTGALFGGGLIGMAISRKVRTSRTNTQIIYNGMTADDIDTYDLCLS